MSDRDLLVADLCFRLPYGLICYVIDFSTSYEDYYKLIGVFFDSESMSTLLTLENVDSGKIIEVYPSEVIPYLLPVESVGENFNHFAKTMQDINGLIPKGLAKDVTGLGIY